MDWRTKIELALAHLAPLLEGQAEAKFEKLRHDPRFLDSGGDPLKASTLTYYSREVLGAGEIRIERGFRRSPQLERALRRKYSGLSSAIVVVTKETDEPKIVERVGQALGREIGNATFRLFSDRQSVALGSGRSVFHVATELARHDPKLDAKGVLLLSLTGHVFGATPQMRADYDADTNVQIMSRAFRTGADTRYLSEPITYADEKDRERALASVWFEGEKFHEYVQEPKIVHAIIGASTLTEGHRFRDFIEKRGAPAPLLEPIRTHLSALVSDVKAIESLHPTWCPVADICNRPLYVPYTEQYESDLKCAELSAEVRDALPKIRKRIDEFKDLLITIKKSQLQEFTGNVIVCTGGRPTKSRLLAYLLDYMPRMINTIAIDNKTAEQMLMMRRFASREAIERGSPVDVAPQESR